MSFGILYIMPIHLLRFQIVWQKWSPNKVARKATQQDPYLQSVASEGRLNGLRRSPRNQQGPSPRGFKGRSGWMVIRIFIEEKSSRWFSFVVLPLRAERVYRNQIKWHPWFFSTCFAGRREISEKLLKRRYTHIKPSQIIFKVIGQGHRRIWRTTPFMGTMILSLESSYCWSSETLSKVKDFTMI